MDRFWSKVNKTAGCWLWTASKDDAGYGGFKYAKKWDKSHRVAYLICKGTIPAGQCVCHTCDNRSCVNPDHLFLGTQKDNMQDCSQKSRIYNSSKTHCIRGHEYSPGNTYINLNRYFRRCRICHTLNLRVRREEIDCVAP
jgi:hypothetical protein